MSDSDDRAPQTMNGHKERASKMTKSKSNPKSSHVYHNKRRVKYVKLDPNAKLKRIHEHSEHDLLSGYHCYVRVRCRNINGWSAWSHTVDVQQQQPQQQQTEQISNVEHENGNGNVPTGTALHFDLQRSSMVAKQVTYTSHHTCVVFENTQRAYIAVADMVMDKQEHRVYEWQCLLQFEDVPRAHKNNVKSAKHKKNKRKVMPEQTIANDSHTNINNCICIGFIADSDVFEECVPSLDTELGRSGTQYAFAVSYDSRVAHAYFTRDNSIHWRCSVTLNEKVCSGDLFRVVCDMKLGKCDIHHNEHRLIDVFNSKIPNKIIPALSGYVANGKASCNIDFISCT